MPLVTHSTAPLSFDTLPALKITHFHQALEEETVYTYMKTYLLGDQLQVQLFCFEQFPAVDSRCALALDFSGGDGLPYLFRCAPVGAVEVTRGGQTVALLSCQHTTGDDEQGHYWAVEFSIDPALAQAPGAAPLKPGSVFAGNLFKYWLQRPAYGAAFDPGTGAAMADPAAFGEFVVVPY